MAEETSYAAKCPKCGKENRITNAYFIVDSGGYQKCYNCGNRFYANKPDSPFKKPNEVEAYKIAKTD